MKIVVVIEGGYIKEIHTDSADTADVVIYDYDEFIKTETKTSELTTEVTEELEKMLKEGEINLSESESN